MKKDFTDFENKRIEFTINEIVKTYNLGESDSKLDMLIENLVIDTKSTRMLEFIKDPINKDFRIEITDKVYGKQGKNGMFLFYLKLTNVEIGGIGLDDHTTIKDILDKADKVYKIYLQDKIYNMVADLKNYRIDSLDHIDSFRADIQVILNNLDDLEKEYEEK